MGLMAASVDRRAWTVPEPIGVVAAISAFNPPQNLVVHQIYLAIASGCPVIVKPATATPLNCVELVKPVHEAGLPDGWVRRSCPRIAFSRSCQQPIPDRIPRASSARQKLAGSFSRSLRPVRAAHSNMVAWRR